MGIKLRAFFFSISCSLPFLFPHSLTPYLIISYSISYSSANICVFRVFPLYHIGHQCNSTLTSSAPLKNYHEWNGLAKIKQIHLKPWDCMNTSSFIPTEEDSNFISTTFFKKTTVVHSHLYLIFLNKIIKVSQNQVESFRLWLHSPIYLPSVLHNHLQN